MKNVIIYISAFMIALTLTHSAYANTDEYINKLLPDEQNTISIFESISPYVVYVHNLQMIESPYVEAYSVKRDNGSGFIWNMQGYIVTNYHVIVGATKLAITLKNGDALSATLVGADPRKDIAVLKLSSKDPLKNLNLSSNITLGNSDDLIVGQKVIAIGNPFGLEQTVTTGIVSGLRRQLKNSHKLSLREMIQTDASINPGNSGGPLLNSLGQVIGMNTLIYSKSGAYDGIGFALPINDIKRSVEQIIQYGKIILPGIGIQPLSDSIAQKAGVQGVIIGKIMPGSPAARAGLRGTRVNEDGKIKVGDIIIGINNKRVKTYSEYYNAMQAVNVGDTVKVHIYRQGKRVSMDMTTINVSQ